MKATPHAWRHRAHSLILDLMVVNGRWPGAKNADHGKNGKTEPLLEEH